MSPPDLVTIELAPMQEALHGPQECPYCGSYYGDFRKLHAYAYHVNMAECRSDEAYRLFKILRQRWEMLRYHGPEDDAVLNKLERLIRAAQARWQRRTRLDTHEHGYLTLARSRRWQAGRQRHDPPVQGVQGHEEA